MAIIVIVTNDHLKQRDSVKAVTHNDEPTEDYQLIVIHLILKISIHQEARKQTNEW